VIGNAPKRSHGGYQGKPTYLPHPTAYSNYYGIGAHNRSLTVQPPKYGPAHGQTAYFSAGPQYKHY